MFVQYNGVNLKVVKLIDWTRQSIYSEDETSYLWTKNKVTFQAVYAGDNVPSFVAKTAPNANRLVIGVNPNSQSPVATDVELRHKLSIPQKKLIVWEASGDANDPNVNQSIVECPVGVAKACLMNGPHPIVHGIEESRGVKTFFITFSIEFAVNECYAAAGTNEAPIVISNTWTSVLSYDENYNTVRKISGTAVLRGDLLALNNLNPDMFRGRIIPAPGKNVKRYLDELVLHPDGHTYSYTVRDIEQPLEYLDYPSDKTGQPYAFRSPRNVTSIQGYTRRTASQAGSQEVIAKGIEHARIMMQGIQATKAAALEMLTISPTGLIQAGNKTADAAQTGLFEYGVAMYDSTNTRLPQIDEEVVVVVQGNKRARKSDLQYLAYSIAFGQLSGDGTTAATVARGAQGGVVPGLTAGIASPATFIQNFIGRILPVANSVTLQYELTENKVTVIVRQAFSGLLDWVTNRTSHGIEALRQPISDQIIGGDWRGVLAPSAVETVASAIADAVGTNYTNRGGSASDPLGQTPDTKHLPDWNMLIVTKNSGTSILPPFIIGEANLKLLAPKLFGSCDILPQPYSDDPERWRPPYALLENNRLSDVGTVPFPNTTAPGIG